MKLVTICAALSLASATTTHAQPAAQAPVAPVVHGPQAVAAELLAVEHAFERRSVSAGAAAAYADFMAPSESLALTGGSPVHGAAAIAAAMGAMMGAGVLDWTPEEVFASTGDLGVTEGRWTFTAKGQSKPMTGHYVTVWRKTAAGVWKGAIDVGVPDS